MTLKQLFAPSDMTRGRPWEKIVLFTVPMLLGNIAQQLYNTVDSIVVGKYIGDNALAAVGVAGPIINLLLVFFVGISVGASILVAQYFGARDDDSLSKVIGTCITVTALTAIVISSLGTLTVRPILEILDTPTSIIDWSEQYLKILLYGVAGVAYYNILCGVLRGLGDSVSALVYLLISTILNIILDILFVAKFQMGVSGVAYATVIAQASSALFCLIKLFHMQQIFRLKWKHLRLSGIHAFHMLRLGLPSGLTQAIFSTAMIIVQNLTNSFGEMVIAASVIIMRVDGFAMMPNFSFGTAMTTYSGQNVGAGRLDQVVKGAKQGMLISVSVSASITILLLLFGKYLMGVFTTTTELVQLSADMMKILAFGYIAMAVTQSLSGVMRGAGDTMTPMWISLLTTVVIRVPLAYGIAWFTRSPQYPNGAYQSVFISLLVSWTMGAVITSVCYAKGKWKNKAQLNNREPKQI